MTSTNFVNGTVIEAAWLNDVDEAVYGVESFGATLSPADATAGFQAAYDEAPTNGKIVVPPGNYIVGSLSGTKTVHWDADGATEGGLPIDLPGVVEGMFQRRKMIRKTQTIPNDDTTLNVQKFTTHTGGTVGFTSSALRVDLTTNAANTNYEWGILSVLENNSTGGQNVAAYLQGNRMSAGVGPTWGSVSEVRERVPINNPMTGLIGMEVDNRSNGTDANFARIGVDVAITRENTAGAATQAGFGFRVQSDRDPNVTVLTGYGFDIQTRVEVGFATHNTTVLQAAFKMAQDQAFAFTADATKHMTYDGSGWAFKDGATVRARFLNTGALQLFQGGSTIQHDGTFSTGGGVPTLSSNKPGANSGVFAWLSTFVNGTQGWIPVFGN